MPMMPATTNTGVTRVWMVWAFGPWGLSVLRGLPSGRNTAATCVTKTAVTMMMAIPPKIRRGQLAGFRNDGWSLGVL